MLSTVAWIALAGVVLAGMNRIGKETARPDDAGIDDWRYCEEVFGPNPEMPRIMARSAITAAVVRGEMNLPEAVARVFALYDGNPPCVEYLRAEYPGASDDVLCARSVIAGVESYLAERPQEQTGQVGRLESELAGSASDGIAY
jgi:hypothetical protein